MAKLILIHGAWHGAWCWRDLLPLLQKQEIQFIAEDLPGSGQSTYEGEITLDAYVTSIEESLKEVDEPAILLGHSMGGMVASLVAERNSDQVKKIIYVSSVLLKDGQSWAMTRVKNVGSTLNHYVVPSQQTGFAEVDPKGLRESFYHRCSEEQIEFAHRYIRPQAKGPFETPIQLTEKNYGNIPKYYIRCLQDRALVPEFQIETSLATPCKEIFEIQSDHSPFFSASKELAQIVGQVVSDE
ncbi:MAG: alpha/beta fold hydrolase [Bdellovibrionales bacterium]|nr:alpha/beta fold hydrolase [Bdellovibrionales bacterium]